MRRTSATRNILSHISESNTCITLELSIHELQKNIFYDTLLLFASVKEQNLHGAKITLYSVFITSGFFSALCRLKGVK